ncbi:MAG: phosphoribosylaminoimidazolesuccinocarboxamide synthase [Defluviitaleaceae bacterium]|nr:phosphoribosylaminoimidazolesuccinocarboxamide synthase [Defluviitaleaceae bacterium]
MYEGKSKILQPCADDNTLIMHYKDYATSLNGKCREEIHGKGKINAAISNLIFRYLEKNNVETHLIEAIDETSAAVKKAEIIMVEVIVRNLAAGSFCKKYGVPEGQRLKNTVLEFCVKSDQLDDPPINISQITAIGLATQSELAELMQQALIINGLLCELFTRAGLQLVDFKLEFGKIGGKIILCDEISPDSCRLWDIKTGDKMDKDRFRLNLGGLLDSYKDVLRRLENVV